MKKLLVGGLVLLLLVTSCASIARTEEPNSSEEPVVLSVAEADSILDMIDDQGLRIALLEADLYEARRHAQVDSALSAMQLDIKEQEVDALRGNWITRLFKHPVVWLALGVWLGAQ